MDIRAYIDSGILELYVMDALTPAERREVEALAEQYPEIARSLRQTEATINAFNLSQAQAPSRDLKGDILARVRAEEKTDVTAPPRSVNWPLWTAWSLAAIATLFAVLCFFQHRELESQYLQQVDQNQQLQQNLDDAQQRLNLISNPGTQAVALGGTDLSPASSVEVFWNQNQQSTLLAIRNLPPPPAGKQYQLWSLLGGQPSSAGLLQFDLNILQAMDPVANADTFAITLEDEGGSAAPDLSQLFVIGTI